MKLLVTVDDAMWEVLSLKCKNKTADDVGPQDLVESNLEDLFYGQVQVESIASKCSECGSTNFRLKFDDGVMQARQCGHCGFYDRLNG